MPAIRQLEVEISSGVAYETALRWQEETVAELKKNPSVTEKLFLVEHTPTVTLGRSGDGSFLKLSPEELATRGIGYFPTRRGGDVTYHGPGQWTVYPVLRLENFCKDLHRYMRLLEELVIRFLDIYDIEGIRVPGKTGVWVRRADGRVDKLAAIGVAVSGWISYHGVAININPDLSLFNECIVPCGISPAEGGVTSLAELLKPCPDMAETADQIIGAFAEVFPFTL
jgi:lipoyl(octanoyl) transferase